MTQLMCMNLLNIPQVSPLLRLQPELRRIAEKPGQSQCHERRYAAFFVEQVVDGLARHADRRGKGRAGEPIVLQKVLTEHLARMGRRDLTFLESIQW